MALPSSGQISLDDVYTELTGQSYFAGDLLDIYPGARVAYSTRRLRRAQTVCMDVERASDNAVITVGFLANGDLDEQAIIDFCGNSIGNVVKWYDQTGQGQDITPTVAGQPPQIYSGSNIRVGNTRPMLYQLDNGTTQSLNFEDVTDTGGIHTLFGTWQWRGGNRGRPYRIGIGGSACGWNMPQSNTNSEQRVFFTDQNIAFGSYSQTTVTHHTMISPTGQKPDMLLWKNGSSQTLTIGSTESFSLAGGMSIFQNTGDTKVGEAVWYTDNQSANRTAIESNQMDYWAPYLLDRYRADVIAAYSLRRLSTSYSGPAIRIREDGGDTQTDIGFVGEDLDVAAIAAHCGSNNGYVVTWYDQVGSKNATQAFPAEQPIIYNGSEVLTLNNGKPRIAGTGASSCTLDLPSNIITGTTKRGSFHVVKSGTVTQTSMRVWVDNEGGGTGRDWTVNLVNGPQGRLQTGSSYKGINAISLDEEWLQSVFLTGTTVASITAYKNGVSNLSGSDLNTSTTVNTLDSGEEYLGFGGGGSALFSQSECVIYTSDKSSDREAIEANIQAYWLTAPAALTLSPTAVSGDLSLEKMSTGVIEPINQDSPSLPNQAPPYSLQSWYGYDHDAIPVNIPTLTGFGLSSPKINLNTAGDLRANSVRLAKGRWIGVTEEDANNRNRYFGVEYDGSNYTTSSTDLLESWTVFEIPRFCRLSDTLAFKILPASGEWELLQYTGGTSSVNVIASGTLSGFTLSDNVLSFTRLYNKGTDNEVWAFGGRAFASDSGVITVIEIDYSTPSSTTVTVLDTLTYTWTHPTNDWRLTQWGNDGNDYIMSLWFCGASATTTQRGPLKYRTYKFNSSTETITNIKETTTLDGNQYNRVNGIFTDDSFVGKSQFSSFHWVVVGSFEVIFGNNSNSSSGASNTFTKFRYLSIDPSTGTITEEDSVTFADWGYFAFSQYTDGEGNYSDSQICLSFNFEDSTNPSKRYECRQGWIDYDTTLKTLTLNFSGSSALWLDGVSTRPYNTISNFYVYDLDTMIGMFRDNNVNNNFMSQTMPIINTS